MKWRHRLARIYWLKVRTKHYPRYARRLGSDAEVLAQLELAMDLLWPLARRVFLMRRVDGMAYCEIANRIGLDTGAVEQCMTDALISIRMVRREFE